MAPGMVLGLRRVPETLDAGSAREGDCQVVLVLPGPSLMCGCKDSGCREGRLRQCQ